ncbi:hypothetical protein lerEdw1_007628 [Lerista edwardsae]|nr:hypothetical protein lerEdw1_007628 [Lerista edwardsae]
MAAAAPPPPPPSSSSQESPSSAWAGGLVFAGSSERDVALSKSFWSSVTLQPPLESRLAPRRGGTEMAAASASWRKSSTNAALLAASSSCAQRRSCHDLGPVLSQSSSFFDRKEEKTQKGVEPEPEISDEKRQYLEKAKTREEILALLRKRREERIMKEMIAQRYKPKIKPQESRVKTPETDNIADEESVKALT